MGPTTGWHPVVTNPRLASLQLQALKHNTEDCNWVPQLLKFPVLYGRIGLTQMVPAFRARLRVLAVSRFLVTTPAASPYEVSLARAITCTRDISGSVDTLRVLTSSTICFTECFTDLD